MKWVGWLRAVAVVVVAALSMQLTASARATLSAKDQEAIHRCVGFMLMGPSYDGIEIRGDKFNCNKMFYRMQGGYNFLGSIKRQRSLGDNSVTVNITFNKDGGMLTQPRKAGPAFFLIDSQPLTFFGVPTTPMDLQTFDIDTTQKTGWERTAEIIMQYAASEIARSWRNKAQPGTVNYFVDMPGPDLRTVKIEAGKTFGGTKVDSKFPATYTSACQAVCNRDSACKAWTLTNTAKVCYLKGAVGAAYPQENATSGIKLN